MNFYPYSCLMMLTKEIHSNIILSTCIQNTRVYSCVILLYTSNITTSTFSLFDFWIKLWVVKLKYPKRKVIMQSSIFKVTQCWYILQSRNTWIVINDFWRNYVYVVQLQRLDLKIVSSRATLYICFKPSVTSL